MTGTAAAAVPPPRQDILGVGIDARGLDEAALMIDRALREGRRVFCITANPEFVMLARRDPDLRAIGGRADLVLADGTGLLVAARLLGSPADLKRARGRDLVLHLAGIVARQDRSLFLLGARPGIAERAAAELRRRHPGLRVAGTYGGSAEPAADPDTVARIAAAAPDALLVAYGMPKQERWIARNLERLPSVRVAVGVGGALDYLAGAAKLPPEWMARVGLEWLWRLLREPWRWRRQLALPAFFWLVLRERMRLS